MKSFVLIFLGCVIALANSRGIPVVDPNQFNVGISAGIKHAGDLAVIREKGENAHLGDLDSSLNNVHSIAKSVVNFATGVTKSVPPTLETVIIKTLKGASNKGDLIHAVIGALSGATGGINEGLARGLSNTFANALSGSVGSNSAAIHRAIYNALLLSLAKQAAIRSGHSDGEVLFMNVQQLLNLVKGYAGSIPGDLNKMVAKGAVGGLLKGLIRGLHYGNLLRGVSKGVRGATSGLNYQTLQSFSNTLDKTLTS